MLHALLAMSLAWADEGPARRSVEVEVERAVQPPDLAVGYRGAGWVLHIPGLTGRLEWGILRNVHTITRPNRERRPEVVRTSEFFVGLELGISVHPYNDNLLAGQGVIGIRKTGFNGVTTGLHLGTGPGLSVANRGVWSVQDGDAQRGGVPVRPAWTTMFGWELGLDLASRGAPVAVWMRPSLALWTPWVTSVVPVVHVDLGVRGALATLRGTR